MLKEFFTNTDVKDDEGLNEKLQGFITKYNNGEIEYTNTSLDDAYELLEQAEKAKIKKQATKFAKEAYKVCPDCFEAILFQVHLEDNPLKRWELLNEKLELERNRLKKEGYFEKDNIGCFYGIFETRPYIRGLNDKAHYLITDGKIKQARDVCKEILRLNEDDNTGIRYLLMAIYAYFQEENDMIELYKKYPEESLEMLLPLFALYCKQENDENAKKYLNKINKANPYFIKFFQGTVKQNKDMLKGYYTKGDLSEVIICFEEFDFLLNTIPNINYYILKNSKMITS